MTTTHAQPTTPPAARGLRGRWRSRSPIFDDAAPAVSERDLARHLGVEPLVARLLLSRGLGRPDLARAFVVPSLKELHDPESLPGCDIAAQRLLQGLDLGEPVVIYGDYDTDGITATAILYHMLKALSPDADVRTYVPHRLDEGYGLNEHAIAELADAGAKLIVSVDCGITAVEPARAARTRGVDLIITDHHNMPGERREDDPDHPPPEFPEAFAIVHPRLPVDDGREPYPFGELCGAGVAFKLAWRLAVLANGGERRVSESMRALLLDLTALAGLGTIADVVPLRDENRLLARFGLQRFKSTELLGLHALLDASGLLGESVDAEDAAFKLAPRLNACGRMGHAAAAVELLTTADQDRALDIARSLNAMNTERRATERRISEQAAELAVDAGMTHAGRRAIVLAHEDWHPGVVGIVCSRLVEKFHRPVILAQRCPDGVVKGSGRSIDGFNLHAALHACAEHLTTFGGHDMAAGLSMHADRFERFVAAFCDFADAAIDDELLSPRLAIDCEARLDELTGRCVDQLELLGPFGRETPNPAVVLRGLAVRDCRTMGAAGAHLDLRVEDPSAHTPGAGWAPRLRLVGWNMADADAPVRVGVRIDAVVRPKLNRFNGSARVEGEIVDLAVVG